jgi:hypothetical protein
VAKPPFPPSELPDYFTYRSVQQPHFHRPAGGASAPVEPSDLPFRPIDWYNPVGLRFIRIDNPPNLLTNTFDKKLVAWTDDDLRENFRYVDPPQQVRNATAIDRPATALFPIINVEGIVTYRWPSRAPDIFPNLAARDKVPTPLYFIHMDDWQIVHTPFWRQDIDPPTNQVVLEGVDTQLYDINQYEWPAIERPKWNHQDPVPNLLVAELKPGPLAYSQKDLSPENPYGFRPVIQPEIVPNNVILGIAPRGPTRLPFSFTNWPVPQPTRFDPAIHYVYPGTQIRGAAAPAPTLVFTVSPSSIFEGEAAILNWSTSFALYVTASSGWSGNKALSGSESTGPLYATTRYDLTATGESGNVFSSVVVSVSARPPTPPTPPPPSPTVAGRSGGRTIIAVKETGENSTAKFDFISSIARGDAIATKRVTASVYSGVDPNPSNILIGDPSVSGLVVKQRLRGGVLGTTYSLVCRVTTSSGNTCEMSAYFSVIPYKGA